MTEEDIQEAMVQTVSTLSVKLNGSPNPDPDHRYAIITIVVDTQTDDDTKILTNLSSNQSTLVDILQSAIAAAQRFSSIPLKAPGQN
jgi:hypothetical protein